MASRGVYSKKVLDDIPKEYHKYLNDDKSDIIVFDNELRRHLIFSNYDYLSSSPMSNMDLIVCRNMLIYLKPNIQDQIAKMFRFSLKTDGYLLLGQSESLVKRNEYFRIVDEQLSIYTNISKAIYPKLIQRNNQNRT